MELCHITRQIVKVRTRLFVNVARIVTCSLGRVHFHHFLEGLQVVARRLLQA